tara:strand:- start:242 stop:2194 length:1953 start_codon:yes stop_codon:yes gene_type:complete
MCGFVGYVDLHGNCQYMPSILSSMSSEIYHRGPDSDGTWLDNDLGIGLAHRRLSIQDLTSSGHQPMLSQSGRFVLIYNGEVYNFRDIRKELTALNVKFKGLSDTEVILSAIEVWGIDSALMKFNGMFSFALWDRQNKELTIARDRMGEKPLYYGTVKGVFLFGSELKALKKHPSWTGSIDRDALSTYMRFSFVPTPYCIYKGINKLKGGHYKVINFSNGTMNEREVCYWSHKSTAKEGVNNPFTDIKSTSSTLDSLLNNSINEQLVADVPVGSFLSGGIDSSLVVAIMQNQSNKPINSFSIGFDESGYNEAHHAKKVARYIGTNHNELYVSGEDARETIPYLPSIYDEPFADESQIPTYLVSKLAKENVTVSLSGDGGDELFGGYNRYTKGASLYSSLSHIPKPLKKILSKGITSLNVRGWDKIYNCMLPKLSNANEEYKIGDKLHKLAKVIDAESIEGMYKGLVSHWDFPNDVVLNGKEYPSVIDDVNLLSEFEGNVETMMFLDQILYMSDGILTKVDRAAMSVSLETRVPLLDRNIVEFSWKVPLSMKIRDGKGKWILRELLYQYVPKDLIERPKMGFSIPIAEWLRGPLSEWAEELLSEKRLMSDGFFNVEEIRTIWIEHKLGIENRQQKIWNVLMFQSWFDSQKIN